MHARRAVRGRPVEDNLNPIGRLYYGFSTLVCTPGSLSQPGRAGLGTQAGEARAARGAARGRVRRGPPRRGDAAEPRARGAAALSPCTGPIHPGAARRGRFGSSRSHLRPVSSKPDRHSPDPATQGAHMSLTIGDTAPDFEADTTEGRDQLPRLDRRRLGRPVLAPARLHAGLHDRARLHGLDQARLRQPQREDHRPLRRPARQPREVGQGHRGDPGHRAELPDDRRHRLRRLQGLRDAPGRRRGRPDRAHAGPERDAAQRLRRSARTRRSSSS